MDTNGSNKNSKVDPKSLTNKAATALDKWFDGRCGLDELGTAFCLVAVLLILINLFAKQQWLLWLALAALAYVLWRMSSKNLERRRQENAAFMRRLGPARKWLKNPVATAQDEATHVRLTCPTCGQVVRVPRGKGRIRVTCPKCKGKFEARS